MGDPNGEGQPPPPGAPPEAGPPLPPGALPESAPPPESGPPPPAPRADPPVPQEPPLPEAPTTGWQVPTPPIPVSGWRLPAGPAPAPVAGHVIAGVGARGIAWILDGILVGLIPAILSLTLIDWAAVMDDIARSIRDQRAGEPAVVALPMTPEVLLVTLIGVGISFLYLVGLWTSSGGATIGMRGLRMRVVDATTGDGLTLSAAVKRWLMIGGPLSLLAVVPGLEAFIGIVAVALPFILLLTTVADERHQGLHDRVAQSLVIRSTSSGSGATFVAGCLVVVIVGLLLLLVTVATFVAIGPALDRLIVSPPNVI